MPQEVRDTKVAFTSHNKDIPSLTLSVNSKVKTPPAPNVKVFNLVLFCTVTYLGTKREILVESALVKFALVPADNFTDGFVAHTAWAAMDFTRHVWILGKWQIRL